MKFIDLFKRNKDDRSKTEGSDYFDCEDAVEAALTYLDNHPSATLEEYEEWLDSRDNAKRKIKESYGN